MPLSHFHPLVQEWFRSRFSEPTDAQLQGWPAIAQGRHTLIAAPTGSGKTLAAFLTCIDSLVRQGLSGEIPDTTQVVYVSPLKALSNDIQKNLQLPLVGIRDCLLEHGLPDVDVRAWVRTGDTPQSERQKAARQPPHILVTTPESAYILLTSISGRNMLRTVRTVIVDEIHAVARDKRGSHLTLTLERLDALCEQRPARIGLSATQKPIEIVSRLLVGVEHDSTGSRSKPCTIIDCGHRREMDLAIEVPASEIEAVASTEQWDEMLDRIAERARPFRTTLVFVNTRNFYGTLMEHFQKMVDWKFAKAETLKLFAMVNTPEEAVQAVKEVRPPKQDGK